jgi:hypothetical protein
MQMNGQEKSGAVAVQDSGDEEHATVVGSVSETVPASHPVIDLKGAKASVAADTAAIEVIARAIKEANPSEKTFPAIAEGAWGWYNNPMSLGGTRPRSWLPLAIAYELSQAIGRSLSLEDLQFLVQKDGEPMVCTACGKGFQPVKWVTITQKLVDALKGGKEFRGLNGEVRWSGSNIVKVGDKGVPRILSFCGSFFYFDPKRNGAGNPEFYSVNRISCLGTAYLHKENCDPKNGHERPVHSRDSAHALVQRMAERHEQAVGDRRRAARDGRVASVAAAFDFAAKKSGPQNWQPRRPSNPAQDRQEPSRVDKFHQKYSKSGQGQTAKV